MKKIIVCLLSIVTILSASPFSISAASGKPISSADEFIAMDPSGEYYLTSDITLKSTYAKTFEGVLDGNGHSITVSEPIFDDFSGKVMNLTIEGKVVRADEDASAFALTSSKGFEAINCTNNAPVTVMGYAKYVSGFVGTCYNAAVKFTNCTNNGAIYLDSTADEKPRAGGFGAEIDTVIMSGCVNNGNVYLKGNIGVAGGLVARVAINAPENYLEIYNSTNNGDVTVEDTYIAKDGSTGTGAADAGGLVGNIGRSKNIGIYKIFGCTNNGNIDAPYRVGGLVGYCYASGYDAYIDMQFCINTGNVIYGRTKAKDGEMYWDFGSGLVAYTNSAGTTIKYSIDAGKVILREGAVTENKMLFIGASSAKIFDYDLSEIYIVNLDIDPSKYIPEMPLTSSVHYIEPVFVDKLHKTTLEDLASGKIAYEINQAAAKDNSATGYSFYQKIGEDALPSVDPSRGWVVLSGDTYANGEPETEPPETTKAPETEAETTKVPETTSASETTNAPETEPPATASGCAGTVHGFAIVIALLGALMLSERKKK